MSIPRTIPGDILFYWVTPKSSLIARLIGAGELLAGEGRGTTLYSHVSIVADGNVQIEAVWPRVRTSRFDPSDLRLELWRVKGADAVQAAKAASCARSHIGEWYSLASLLFGLFPSRNARNCARLVNAAWAEAGNELCSSDDKFMTPNDMAQSDKIERIA